MIKSVTRSTSQQEIQASLPNIAVIFMFNNLIIPEYTKYHNQLQQLDCHGCKDGERRATATTGTPIIHNTFVIADRTMLTVSRQ